MEREYGFLQRGGWVFWVAAQIVSGGVHGPRLGFKSAEEGLGLDLDFKAT